MIRNLLKARRRILWQQQAYSPAHHHMARILIYTDPDSRRKTCGHPVKLHTPTQPAAAWWARQAGRQVQVNYCIQDVQGGYKLFASKQASKQASQPASQHQASNLQRVKDSPASSDM